MAEEIKNAEVVKETIERKKKEGNLKKVSDLVEKIENTFLRNAFPDELKERLIDISIPTYGQMFGHDETYREYFKPDNDEQFKLMKIRKNRISDFDNKPEWCWLQNATKEEVSATFFTIVNGSGYANYHSAANSAGVRPVFTTTYKTVQDYRKSKEPASFVVRCSVLYTKDDE